MPTILNIHSILYLFCMLNSSSLVLGDTIYKNVKFAEADYVPKLSSVLGLLDRSFKYVLLNQNLQLKCQIVHPSCSGQLGLITILAQGGNPPYLYFINGNPVNPTSNLFAGNYTVTVLDAQFNSCQISVVVIDPPPLSFSASVLPPACPSCPSAVYVSVFGGSPPYQVSVSNLVNASPWYLFPGTYNLFVIDDNACSLFSNFKIPNFKFTKSFNALNPFQVCHALSIPIHHSQSKRDTKKFKLMHSQGSKLCFASSLTCENDFIFEFKSVDSTQWNSVHIDTTEWCLNQLTPNTVYICRFKTINQYGKDDDWVYDTCFTTSGCSLPVFSRIVYNGNSLNLSWNHPNDCSFQLAYKPSKHAIWQSIYSNDSEIKLSHLVDDSYYQIRLRAECPNGDVSAWEYDSVFTPAARYIDTILNSDTTMVQSIYIYPNPANQFISVQYPVTACERVLCRIIDPIGRIVYEEAHQICPGNPLSIPLHHLNQGVYTFSLENQHQVRYNRRFVKE